MINHVVLFKMKDFPADEKREKMEQIKSALEALKDKIQELKYLEVGLNYETPSKSFDLCLISHFDDLAALEIYRVHPEHLKVFELIKETTEARSAVDFEF